jgi:hypothetical protein
MIKMFNGKPRGCTDIPAEVDKFDIQKYIDGLTKFIEECDTPMTIAVQGDWGTGKTSVMRMVKNGLKDKFDNIIWFNTWQFAQFDMGDQLPMLLLSKLLNSLGASRAEIVKSQAAVAIKGIVEAVTAFATQGATDGSAITNLLVSDNVADSFENLSKAFAELVKSKTKDDKDRVIIFVDDLDRLAPEKAVELLEVMKNFFDCERCVFVLAVDYGVVIRGVRAKYGQDFDMEKGKSFFDKIIQVPFRMPVSRYDIEPYVKDNLQRIGININDDEAKKYVDLINSSIGRNPRSMKRLFNSFLLLEGVANKEIMEDSNSRLILFALLCMQSRFDKIYDYIVLNRETIDKDFLEGLTEDDSNIIKGMDISDDETQDFCIFARLFYDIIDQNSDSSLSENELDNFQKVLDFSSITSKDITEKITTNRGSRVVTDLSEFTIYYRTQDQIETFLKHIKHFDILPSTS